MVGNLILDVYYDYLLIKEDIGYVLICSLFYKTIFTVYCMLTNDILIDSIRYTDVYSEYLKWKITK